MTSYDMDRERNWRDQENDNDWDWYYYEYRYLPYSSNQDMYNNWSRGPYTGKGPRGYQRSDDRIKEDINERLTWHSGIDPTDVQVDVSDGTATLTGSVNSRYEKRMAEDIAESVFGIQDVNNNLSINRQQSRWNRGGRGMRMGNQIQEGMDVVGRDGDTIGQVKEVRSNDFLVDRSMARDVYVPLSACQMQDGQIRLNIRADEVDNQDWAAPDLFGTEETASSSPNRR